MEIVNRIIEIDRLAESRLSDARKRSEEIVMNAKKDSETLKSEISAAAQKRISEIETINKNDFDSQLAELEKQHDLENRQMDSFFESNHEKIENIIFAEIVGE